MPTRAQIQTVIDTLKKSLEFTGNELDLSNPFNPFHFSFNWKGACHAGHYYLGKTLDTKSHTIFKEGAKMMAQDLGFDNTSDLEYWASTDDDIWNNKYGKMMFVDERAFINDKNPFGAKDLLDIIYHWELVGENLSKYSPHLLG